MTNGPTLSRARLASRDVILGVLLLCIYIPPYFVRWPPAYALATLLIALVMYGTYGKQAAALLGLPRSMGAVCSSLLALGATIYAAYWLHGRLIAETNLTFVPHEEFWRRVKPFFQALNDEMLLRGLLLFVCLKSKLPRLVVLLGHALFFTLLHIAYYLILSQAAPSYTALTTLFMFGLCCNFLFVRFGHIGYCVALHAGWNLVRFGGSYYQGSTYVWMVETFALLEGSPQLFALSALLLAVSLFLLRCGCKGPETQRES